MALDGAKASFLSRARRCIVWRRMPSLGLWENALFLLPICFGWFCVVGSYVYMSMYVCIYIHIYIYIWLYTLVYMCIYIYVYLHIAYLYIVPVHEKICSSQKTFRSRWDPQLCRVQCPATTRRFWEPYFPAVCRLVLAESCRCLYPRVMTKITICKMAMYSGFSQ